MSEDLNIEEEADKWSKIRFIRKFWGWDYLYLQSLLSDYIQNGFTDTHPSNNSMDCMDIALQDFYNAAKYEESKEKPNHE